MLEDESIEKSRKINYILMIGIIVAFTAFAVFFRSGGNTVDRITFHNEGFLTIRQGTDTELELPYANISTVEFYEDADFGESVGGNTVDGVREGLWYSAALGEYTASLSEKIPACILIRYEGNSYAINYESVSTTKAIYEALTDAIS